MVDDYEDREGLVLSRKEEIVTAIDIHAYVVEDDLRVYPDLPSEVLPTTTKSIVLA